MHYTQQHSFADEQSLWLGVFHARTLRSSASMHVSSLRNETENGDKATRGTMGDPPSTTHANRKPWVKEEEEEEEEDEDEEGAL